MAKNLQKTENLGILTKIGYNSVDIRDISKHVAPSRGVFKVVQFNGIIEIYERPTLVAMATKIWEL